MVGISLGDPSGIGPEVVSGALRRRTVSSALIPVLFGDAGSFEEDALFRRFTRCTPLTLPKKVSAPVACEVTRLKASERRPGKPSLAGGHAQLVFIRAAVAAAQAGKVTALCTAPVSKEQISRTGTPFLGHTELLADAFGCEVLMLMDGPRLKVALATNHLPLSAVPGALRIAKLVAQLSLLSRSLKPLLKRRPVIAVCGLNPHAGDGGFLGQEEEKIIAPAIARSRALGIACTGPYSADGLFAQNNRLAFDVALAMYHDQGLIVVKALDFSHTVNVTLGLPVPRTSPDHGTAYSLAGRGEASVEPMVAALLRAAQLARGQVPAHLHYRALKASEGEPSARV